MNDIELDDALQQLYPTAPHDGDALRRARRRVLTTIDTTPPATRRGVPWRRLSIAAAAVAVASVTATVAVTHRGDPGPTAMVEVAQTLNTAADAQIHTRDQTVPPGKYRYIATHALNMSYSQSATADFAVRTGTRIETWVPADRTATWFERRTDTGERTWLVGTAQQAHDAGVPDPRAQPEQLHGRCGNWNPDPGTDPCAAAGNWQTPGDTFTAELPRNPYRLYQRLRKDTAGHGNDADQEVLVYAADALRSGLLPADLRAALYRALTYLPTLTITERTATLDGRAGTALGIAAAGERQEIIIDPADGTFIGERTRLTADRDGIPAGTVTGSSSLQYGIAERAGEPPHR